MLERRIEGVDREIDSLVYALARPDGGGERVGRGGDEVGRRAEGGRGTAVYGRLGDGSPGIDVWGPILW